jgi:hypothetical protein
MGFVKKTDDDGVESDYSDADNDGVKTSPEKKASTFLTSPSSKYKENIENPKNESASTKNVAKTSQGKNVGGASKTLSVQVSDVTKLFSLSLMLGRVCL